MDNYETEEQQVEAIKKWWAKNYKLVIVLAAVGLGSIVGVQQWKRNKIMTAQAASLQYDQVLAADKADNGTLVRQVNIMKADYADLPYAALSVMLEAKQLIAAGKPEEAEQSYQWVIAHTQVANLQHLSRIRLARLQAEQGNNEQALNTLEAEPGAFKAMYLELKGDILVSLKQLNEARSAYDEALQAYAALGSSAQILQIKRNDLGNS